MFYKCLTFQGEKDTFFQKAPILASLKVYYFAKFPLDERETQSGASSMSKQVKKRMTMTSAIRKFKSKIGTPSGAAATSGGGPKR